MALKPKKRGRRSSDPHDESHTHSDLTPHLPIATVQAVPTENPGGGGGGASGEGVQPRQLRRFLSPVRRLLQSRFRRGLRPRRPSATADARRPGTTDDAAGAPEDGRAEPATMAEIVRATTTTAGEAVPAGLARSRSVQCLSNGELETVALLSASLSGAPRRQMAGPVC